MIISFIYALFLYILARLIPRSRFIPTKQLTEEIYHIRSTEKLVKISIQKETVLVKTPDRNKINTHQIFDIFSRKIVGCKKINSKQKQNKGPPNKVKSLQTKRNDFFY